MPHTTTSKKAISEAKTTPAEDSTLTKNTKVIDTDSVAVSDTPSSEAPVSDTPFSSLGIDDDILALLTKNNIITPTPIQQQSIPVALEGKDIIGIAQTGTGKTLAFAIPIIQRLGQSVGTALILLPTRELAMQVEETFRMVGWPLGVRTAVLIGGVSAYPQIQQLRQKPHVIIGTPGRIIDHIQQKTLSLEDVEILALDEADRMLDMGFAPQIKIILKTVPQQHQTLLFSATMPQEIVKMAMDHMQLPIRIEIAKQGTASKNVEQEVFIVQSSHKMRLLEMLLRKYTGTILIFVRTKFGVKKICQALNATGNQAAEIHSNRSFSQRQAALRGFKTGSCRILVATDIASRGIDVKGIEVVINYDVPEQAEDYIHRIGRTGRAEHTGRAITFAMPDQGGKMRQIERLMRTTLKVSQLPPLPGEAPGTNNVSSALSERERSSSSRRRPSSGAPRRGPSNGGSSDTRGRAPARPSTGSSRYGASSSRRPSTGSSRSSASPRSSSRPSSRSSSSSARPSERRSTPHRSR